MSVEDFTTGKDDDFAEAMLAYRVEAFDKISCVNDETQICPGKYDMVTTAMSGITKEDIDNGQAEVVQAMVCLKLAGYEGLGKGIVCEAGTCSVRDFARDSIAVSATVKSINRLGKSGLLNALYKSRSDENN